MISHIQPGPRGTVSFLVPTPFEQYFGSDRESLSADEAERIGRALIDAAEKSRIREWENAGGSTQRVAQPTPTKGWPPPPPRPPMTDEYGRPIRNSLDTTA